MMRARLALAAALTLWPAFASAQFAVIAPDTPIGDSSDRIANTRALLNGLANNPLASGKIFIGSAGGIATGQTMSGDATLSILGALTLATVNANVGTFGSATQCPSLTVNAKGLVTAASQATCTPAVGSITGLGTGVATALGNAVNATGGVVSPTPTRAGDVSFWNGSAWTSLAGNNSGTNCLQENASGVPSWASCGGGSSLTVGTTIVNGGPGILSNASSGGTLVATAPGTGVLTALGVNVGSAGAFVTFNGALGTPSSGVGTNLTGTASGLTAGNVTTNANLTGPVTSVGNATTIGANQVSRANEAQGVARSVIGVTGNATANVADIQGTANQFLGVNNAGTALAFNTMSQDCTLATGVITCTKTNNVSFSALATTTPGTGVATALGVNVGTAGAFVTNGGALGTPSSGTLTNATGLPNAGLVNSSTTVAGATCTLGSTCGLTSATNSLGAPVNLTNVGYTDGPSAANGTTGTWFASGTVTLTGTTGDLIVCQLYDGTNLIASANQGIQNGGSLALSGIRTNPAGNIRIACENTTASRGTMASSNGITGNASTVTAFRIN